MPAADHVAVVMMAVVVMAPAAAIAVHVAVAVMVAHVIVAVVIAHVLIAHLVIVMAIGLGHSGRTGEK